MTSTVTSSHLGAPGAYGRAPLLDLKEPQHWRRPRERAAFAPAHDRGDGATASAVSDAPLEKNKPPKGPMGQK